MKIRDHELKQIIKEELTGVIQEAERTEGVPWRTVFRRLGRAAMKGFMGKDSNVLSQAAYRAWGGTRVYAIDQLFKELTNALSDFKSHDEFKNLIDPKAADAGTGRNPEVLLQELEEWLNETMQQWAAMSVAMRGEEGEGKPEEAEMGAPAGPTGEEGASTDIPPTAEEPIAEIIRRQVRREMKKRFIS